MFLEPFVGHAGLGCRCTCESPRPFPAEPYVQGRFQGRPQLEELPDLGTGKPPLFPIAHTHSASEPVVDFRDGTVIFRYTEVIHPSPDILGEFLVTILHGDEPASSGQEFDPSLEFAKGLVRPSDFGSLEGKTEEVGIIRCGNPAFVLIDLELEFIFQKACNAFFYPQPCPLSPD